MPTKHIAIVQHFYNNLQTKAMPHKLSSNAPCEYATKKINKYREVNKSVWVWLSIKFSKLLLPSCWGTLAERWCRKIEQCAMYNVQNDFQVLFFLLRIFLFFISTETKWENFRSYSMWVTLWWNIFIIKSGKNWSICLINVNIRGY